MDEWLAYFIPSWISIGTSSFFLGCAASSRSFAESLSVRAVSTGPKTRLFNLALFAFLVLARAPFAMVDNRWSTNQSTWDLDGKVLNIKQQKNLRFFGYFWRGVLSKGGDRFWRMTREARRRDTKPTWRVDCQKAPKISLFDIQLVSTNAIPNKGCDCSLFFPAYDPLL